MSEFDEIKELNFLWFENFCKRSPNLTGKQIERMWFLAGKRAGRSDINIVIELVEKEREINKMLTEALEWTAASSRGDIKLAASAALAKAEGMRG